MWPKFILYEAAAAAPLEESGTIARAALPDPHTTVYVCGYMMF